MTLKQVVANLATDQFKVLPGGEDTVLVPMMGMNGQSVFLPIRIDSNVFYHLYCTDPNTIAAVNALRGHDDAGWTLFEIESAYQIDFEPESECLQITAIRKLGDVAPAVLRMAQAAVAIQAMAFGLTEWVAK